LLDQLCRKKYAIVATVIHGGQAALTDEERDGIVLAVKSAFSRLKNLYKKITPVFLEYGFTPPSPGVLARDLSERIEKSIVQHCESFSRGEKHCDLSRAGCDWEVKIAKGSGLTINQSKQIAGETYIVVNYTADIQVTKVWVLWGAKDPMFSPRKANTNARALLLTTAGSNIELLFSVPRVKKSSGLEAVGKPKSAKADLADTKSKKHSA
jgi:hypothetical protein